VRCLPYLRDVLSDHTVRRNARGTALRLEFRQALKLQPGHTSAQHDL
jgi:hypothetical protein